MALFIKKTKQNKTLFSHQGEAWSHASNGTQGCVTCSLANVWRHNKAAYVIWKPAGLPNMEKPLVIHGYLSQVLPWLFWCEEEKHTGKAPP